MARRSRVDSNEVSDAEYTRSKFAEYHFWIRWMWNFFFLRLAGGRCFFRARSISDKRLVLLPTRLLERRCLVILSELPLEIDGGDAVITAAPKIAQLPRGFTFEDLGGFCGLKPALAEASRLKGMWREWGRGWKKAKENRLAEELVAAARLLCR
jgi:hypothetical protein